jgi:4-carboxymuconolactone decarboxylase
MDKRDFKTRHDEGYKARTDMIRKKRPAPDDFNRPFQELLNTYCFNEIWNRPGLSRRDRSLINIAMLSALNRPAELRTHLNAAIVNGVKKAEIQEVLLQIAVYCGVPAGVEGFRAATEVFAEHGG